jgi:hypothetical protein
VNRSNEKQEQRFPWSLTQEHIDLLAAVLYKAETVFSIVEPGCIAAERTACLLTELREECCQRAGAADPFPDMPLSPRFDGADPPFAGPAGSMREVAL